MKSGGDAFLKRAGYITAALLIGTLALAGTVSGATNVSACGTTISSSGTYVLNTSINDYSGTCITIDSSDVVFDGGGYTIDGTGSSFGVYVYKSGSTLTNVTVKNLNVTDWQTGIYIRDSSSSSITNNTVSNNAWWGIYLRTSSNSNTIANNTASSNGNDGVYLLFSSNNTIANNTASLNTEHYGIYLNNANNNTIEDNTANSNSRRGIYLYSSSNNTIKDNTANSNSHTGIYLEYYSSGNIANNTANSNSHTGIYVSQYSNSNITDNNASSNTWYGIHLKTSSSNNNIRGNNASKNGQYGIYLQGANSNYNTIANNTVNSNIQHGISLISSSKYNTIANNTASNNPYGIFLYASNPLITTSNPNYNNITNNNVSGGFYGVLLYGADNNTISNNTASDNTYYGISLQNGSDYNTIANNTATNNYFGVYLAYSDNNNVTNNDLDTSYYFGVAERNSTENTISDSGTVGNFTDDVFGVRVYTESTVQYVAAETDATYIIKFENLGNLMDTFDITVSGPDGVDYELSCRVSCPNVSQSKNHFSGLSDERKLTVSSSNVGGYHVNITLTSWGDTNVSDTIETLTIVHGDDHPNSANISSTTTNSDIYYSVIENSTVINSNISYSEIYNSVVINSDLENVIVTNSLVVNGNITNGTIKFEKVVYNIARNITVAELISGSDEKKSTLFGMTEANKNLDFNASNANLSFSITPETDYIGGSLTSQRSAREPANVLNQSNNIGGYSWITPSTNIEESIKWVYMKIYYNESELGDMLEEDLKFQFFNTTTQKWEYLNKTFAEDFTDNNAWDVESGTWTASGGRYNGSSTETAISTVKTENNTALGNTYIQVSMNVTNATSENGLVIFSYSNTSDFYYAGIRNHSQFTSVINSTSNRTYSNSTFNWVVGYFNGSWNDFNTTTEAINETVEYDLDVFIEGGNVSLMANGEKKANYTYSSLPVGRVGIAVYDSTNYFDDFRVYHPKSGVNTEENYVWGNSTHFSVYGMHGSVYGMKGSVYGGSGNIVTASVSNTPDTSTTPSSSGDGGDEGSSSPIGLISSGTAEMTSTTYSEMLISLSLRGKINRDRFVETSTLLAGPLLLTKRYPLPTDPTAAQFARTVTPVTGNVYALAAEACEDIRFRYAEHDNKLVIARGDLGVDSMAAVAYAKAKNIPILLVTPDELPSMTAEAITLLQSTGTKREIIIIGGPAAVSAAVEDELAVIGSGIKRIYGETRIETAVALAEETYSDKNSVRVIVVTDYVNPKIDAALMSYVLDAPLLYVKSDGLSPLVRDYISEHKETIFGPTKVVLIGVDPKVASEINIALS